MSKALFYSHDSDITAEIKSKQIISSGDMRHINILIKKTRTKEERGAEATMDRMNHLHGVGSC